MPNDRLIPMTYVQDWKYLLFAVVSRSLVVHTPVAGGNLPYCVSLCWLLA
jgi:hypothetical protein